MLMVSSASQRAHPTRLDERVQHPRMTLSIPALATCLAERWEISTPSITSHDHGMNSRTWFVSDGEGRYVAKAVPAHAHRRFVSGLAVASHVQAAGIPAGAAVPTRDGRPFVQGDGHTLALLGFVAGSALLGESEAEQRIIGTTLSRAHRALIGGTVPDADRFHWIDPRAEHLGIRDWVRPAVVDALETWERLSPQSLTWGLLHTDPAPEAFLFDSETGTCGLIDWDTGMIGPLMYDLASAVMYVGGTNQASRLISAYLDDQLLQTSEVERTLEPMLRFRWAVQADYFARRINTSDLTGIQGPDENEQGLEDARVALMP